MKQVQPTFGVSFGLPQPSNGGYPINPFHANPIYNPYGPALNGGGLNLGLVSVNPLLAVQVTKNDYGEKVVKPFVNLHVTPNEHIVNKLSHAFHEKKLYLLNKHEHYHHHKPYGHHYGHYDQHVHKPIHHPIHPIHPIHPPIHSIHSPIHSPPYASQYGPPVYSPHHTHYEPDYSKFHPHIAHEAAVGNEDYYDDDNHFDDNIDYNNPYQGGYYNPGFERSANASSNANERQGYANRFSYSRSLTLPSKNPGANRGGQTIRFPENRKKREVMENPGTENVEEVTKTP